MNAANQSTLHDRMHPKSNRVSALNRGKYSETPSTPSNRKRPAPLSMVSLVRVKTVRTAEDAMEIEEVVMGDEVPEVAKENKTMAEASNGIAKENKVPEANVAAAEEEARKKKNRWKRMQ